MVSFILNHIEIIGIKYNLFDDNPVITASISLN